jgi:hypothetical protein
MPVLLFLVSALATVLSLASVVSTHAMPVEARTTEPWYSYQTNVKFDYVALVEKGKFYPTSPVKPDQLMRIRGPVEPPTFRRVLITQFTDALEVRMPYSFTADRPADLKVKWRVDGMLVIPGVWQQPYPLVAQKESTLHTAEVKGVETFTIPVAELLADMAINRAQYSIHIEPLELHIKPVLEVEVIGLPEPLAVTNEGEFLVSVRQNTTEVDDVRDLFSEKSFAETKIVPITVSILGMQVRVQLVRQIAIAALVIFLLFSIGVVWSRRTKPDNRSLLQKLGPNLIAASSFEVPGDTAVVAIRNARELIQLQAHAERPVIRVGANYYLQDGTTCYRLTLKDAEETDGDE